jgi:hypothetical protein
VKKTKQQIILEMTRDGFSTSEIVRAVKTTNSYVYTVRSVWRKKWAHDRKASVKLLEETRAAFEELLDEIKLRQEIKEITLAPPAPLTFGAKIRNFFRGLF